MHRPTTLSGRSEALFATAPTPIVGRTKELDFLLDQWRRTVTGDGRVVLLSGEPGIGKSRLLAALEERLTGQRHFSLRYFCSPHHQDDALYPIISRWERELGFGRNDTPDDKLRKLESLVASRGLAPEGLPLLAAMLSIPLGDRYPGLDLSPQRRKEKTFDVLIQRLADLARYGLSWRCSRMPTGPTRQRWNWLAGHRPVGRSACVPYRVVSPRIRPALDRSAERDGVDARST